MNLTKGGTISGATTVAAALQSVGTDRSVYTLPGHTVKTPRVLIFDRQLPGTGDKEVLRSHVKLVYADRNADGTARSGSNIVEAFIRTPQDQPASLTQEALDMLIGVLRDTSIMTTNVSSGAIPLGA